ncbi:MAG TPA: ABC transporter ATP-binding protein [Erysipelotrichaceae bacterium]|nr:ABC transporter ATP-binding protein [Erysipelotrichaceae bacterium]
MLKVEHISKTFNPGTVNAKKALDDLSLTAEDGDFITIVGDNGAGKSTLFNAIAGRFLVDRGRIILDGSNITFVPEYKRARYMGQMFQDPLRGTAPHMTIEENLAMAYLRAGESHAFSRITKRDEKLFQEKLAALNMGLEDRMHTPVGTLSGGQRQALTLLMASLQKPKILLLDEHTAALDPKTARNVLDLTQQVVDESHLTTLMVTHNMNDAIRMGNRLIMMNEGKIIWDVSGEEKKHLQVSDLLDKFSEVSHGQFANDRMMLT